MVLAPFQLAELGQPPAQGALDRSERRVQLNGDFAEAETLQVRPFDHRPLEFGQPRQLPAEPLPTLVGLLGGAQSLVRTGRNPAAVGQTAFEADR